MTDIIERLRADMRGAKGQQIDALAIDMGVRPHTLRKIVRAHTQNPRYDTVKAIQSYYDRLPIAPRHLPDAE